MISHAAPERSTPPATVTWPLERVLFAIAGTVVLVAALLTALFSPWWLLLVAFVGLNQLAFAAFRDCPSSYVLRRWFGVRRGCVR